MRLRIYILPFLLFYLGSCTPATTEKELSPEEQAKLDSVSKLAQRRQADSLKKTNPLLIVPPDSTYSGEYTDKYANGIVKFKGYFRIGQRHGQWMSFYPNGVMWSEMHYDKGLRHGPNTTYFENGQVRYSGFYKDDVRDSIWCYFDSTGKLAQKVLFKNDKIIRNLPPDYVGNK